jgi:hypothetical protein
MRHWTLADLADMQLLAQIAYAPMLVIFLDRQIIFTRGMIVFPKRYRLTAYLCLLSDSLLPPVVLRCFTLTRHVPAKKIVH